MGMDHGDMEMDGMEGMGGGEPAGEGSEPGGHEMRGGHDMADAHGRMPMAEPTTDGGPLRPPGTLPDVVVHGPGDHGPGEAGIPMAVGSRLHEPGVGLGEDG